MSNFVTWALLKVIVKTVDFSETVAACVLKVGRCRQLIEFMKICEYSRSRSFFDHGPRSFTYENQNLLFSEPLGHF